MKRRTWLLAAAAIIGIAGIISFRRPAEEIVPALATASLPVESAGMCPWRTPQSDMQRFFPGADRYDQRLLILSDIRLEILRRLGPSQRMDANGIYCYPVYQGATRRGTVLVQRTPGEYGVVEYVVGMTTAGQIAGIHIQRLRETNVTSAALASPVWLHAFAGKTADAEFRLGSDLPNVPGEARPTAQSLVDSIRRLVIEYDVARRHGR